MIAQLSGAARIEFRDSSVGSFDTEIGDFVYVPGGTPHRIVPKSESIHIRYKAEHPGLEAVAWYDEASGQEISRVTWDCAERVAARGLPSRLPRLQRDAGHAQSQDNRRDAARDRPDAVPLEEIAAEIKAAEASEQERARRKGVTPPPRKPRRPARQRSPAPRPTRHRSKPTPMPMRAWRRRRWRRSFPISRRAAMVPCAIMQGPKRNDRGYFVHRNTVQEVNLCLGAEGAPFPFPGMVAVGPLTHPVGDKPGQPPGAAYSVMMLVITQRQAVDVPQNEATVFHCEKCDAELFRRDYDAYDFPGALEGPSDLEIIGLPTISQSAASALAFNESAELRTCKSCGHSSALPARALGLGGLPPTHAMGGEGAQDDDRERRG